MRTLAVNQQTVKIIAPSNVTGTLGSKTLSYAGTPTSVTGATAQPLSSAHARAEYGARADRIRLLLLPLDTTVKENYGVWLAADNTSLPPWVVISVSVWSTHIACHIERRDAVGI